MNKKLGKSLKSSNVGEKKDELLDVILSSKKQQEKETTKPSPKPIPKKSIPVKEPQVTKTKPITKPSSFLDVLARKETSPFSALQGPHAEQFVKGVGKGAKEQAKLMFNRASVMPLGTPTYIPKGYLDLQDRLIQEKASYKSDYIPQSGVEKAGAILGRELPMIPFWMMGYGAAGAAGRGLTKIPAIAQVASRTPKIVKGGLADAFSYGSVVAPVETLLERGSLKDLAEKEKALPFIFGGGTALRGVGKLLGAGATKGLDASQLRQAEIPALEVDPLKAVQDAYRTPSLRDVRQRELEQIFTSSDQRPLTTKYRSLRAEDPAEYFGKKTQADLEAVFGGPIKRYRINKDLQNVIKEIETEMDNRVASIVQNLKQIDKETKTETIRKRVKDMGGIRQGNLDIIEEQRVIPNWIRNNKTGRPLDEVADELGMDSEELLAAIRDSAYKPRDYETEALRILYRDPEYQALSKTLDYLKSELPGKRTVKSKPKLKPKEIKPKLEPLRNELRQIEIPKPEPRIWTNREGIPISDDVPISSITPENIDKVLGGRATSRIEHLQEPRVSESPALFPAEMSPEGLQRLRPDIPPIVPKQAKGSPILQKKGSSASRIEPALIPREPISPVPETLRDPILPKGRRERGAARNIRTDEARPLEARQKLTETPQTYEQIPNPKVLRNVENIMNEGLEKAIVEFERLNAEFRPEAPPLLKKIVDQLYAEGNGARADKLIVDAAEKATQAGQYTQTWKLLRSGKDSTAFKTLIGKQLKKLNEEGSLLYKKKWKEVKLNADELDAIWKLRPGDEAGHEALFNQIRKRISNELPASIYEKINAWRHVSMLLNPKTQVRNVVGNAIMMGMRHSSQRISAILQKITLPAEARTQAFSIGKESKDMARAYFELNKKDILRNPNKYLETIKLNMPDKRVFRKSRIAEKAGLSDKLTLSLGKKGNVEVDFADLPEEMRRFTYWILEAGDTPFLRNAYVNRLASYIEARGIKDIASIPKEAHEIALKEALESTFKDASNLAKFINSIKNPRGDEPWLKRTIGAVAAESLLPFVQTPINIVRRGIQYSPVSVVDSLIKKQKVKGAIRSGRMTAEEGARRTAASLDEMAKGLTGSGIVALGFLLAKYNILTGDEPDDRDLREYNKATGNAAFSVLGKATYDWAEPFAIPLVIGVELYNSIKDHQDNADKLEEGILGAVIGGVSDGVKASINTILDMSLLQGIQSVVGHEGGVAEGFTEVPSTYAQQFIPSFSAQLARIADPTVRRTYVKGDKVQSAINAAMNKIPFASRRLEPKITPFGDDMTRFENHFGRAMDAFLNPAIISKNQNINQEIDAEIRRLADSGYKRHIPTQVNSYIEETRNYPKLDLTQPEITQYQKRTGELTKKRFIQIIRSGEYINSPDEVREKLLADAIAKAKKEAKAEIVRSRGYRPIR
jgi:hypothetical protein